MKYNYEGRTVDILEGEFSGESGIFLHDISYTGWAGLICAVDIDDVVHNIPADYFIFQDYNIQMRFEDEDCNRV